MNQPIFYALIDLKSKILQDGNVKNHKLKSANK